MKRIVLLVFVALGASIWVARAYTARKVFDAYRGFADSWAKEDRVAAEKFSAGKDVIKHAFEERALRGNRGGAAMEAFRGTNYEVESRKGVDGEVHLIVVQTIRFDPPGATTGIGGAMWARYRDEATVKETLDGWRVTAFEPTFVDMGDVKRR